MSVVSVVICQIEVSATGRSPVQSNPTECGESECGREASILRKSWLTRRCCGMGDGVGRWGGGGTEREREREREINPHAPKLNRQH